MLGKEKRKNKRRLSEDLCRGSTVGVCVKGWGTLALSA